MSNFFNKYPNTAYEFNGSSSIVKDIFRRTVFASEYKPYSDLYDDYLVKDGETPESISKIAYGDHAYHWVVLVFNEIHNTLTDWPMNQLDLELYCTSKYGSAQYLVSHYQIDENHVGETKDFVDAESWVAPVNPFPNNTRCIPVTFFDMENTLNDKKRNIRLLRPELLSSFISQYESSLNG